MSISSARTEILAAVRAARPPAVAEPARWKLSPLAASDDTARVDEFMRAATAAGAVVVACAADDVLRLAAGAAAGGESILSLIPGLPSTVSADVDPHALSTLDVFLCDVPLGVAENGAVWIATANTVHRAALFLAARVVLVVHAESIVSDLHQAYDRLDIRTHPFGVFIAGPSKTADIEQSLVVGAHGPMELTIIVARSPATHSA